MATYLELRNQFSNDDLRNKVTAAVVIAAYNLTLATPTANENAWISSVLSTPEVEGRKAFKAVLAANKSATVNQIESATDAAIQTHVDAIVATLVKALAGV